MVDKRNADFHDLERRLTFESGMTTYDGLKTQGVANLAPSPLNIYESDVLIWLVSKVTELTTIIFYFIFTGRSVE